MPLSKWKTLASSDVLKNAWWTYRRDQYQLPGGASGEYHYVHTNGASLIVPVLNYGRFVLVNQYRYLCKRESLEFPCGGVKAGKTYDQTAAEELEEEVGYIAREWKTVGEFNPYNGVTDEMCRLYIARNLTPVPARPDETEEFETFVLSADELESRILSGVIWDGMTIAAWTIAKNHV